MAGVAAVLALALVLAYRHHQQQRIVAISVARAQQLIRADTWLGYHEAAALLGVRAAAIDPLEAGALRAFALAMLSLDYRDKAAVVEANAALVEPGRAPRMSPHAQLAVAALALGESRAGTALDYASRAGDGALPQALHARVALLAGNASAASEAVERALTVDPDLPAALALKGDLLYRAGQAADAQKAYTAAVAASARALSAGLAGSSARAGASAPHARATFGFAKLALSREIPADSAVGPLSRILDDRVGTPQVERARSALYLSALQARAGDRSGAAASLDKAGLDGDLRAWLERAAGQVEVERGRYRVPDGTPGALVSASDDDSFIPPPPPPQVKPSAPRPVIHGFKVHPLAKKAKSNQGARAKKPVKKKAHPTEQ
jgi:tetratricopeptide (TPR) repeat protein